MLAAGVDGAVGAVTGILGFIIQCGWLESLGFGVLEWERLEHLDELPCAQHLRVRGRVHGVVESLG